MVQNSSRTRLAIISAITDEGLKRGDDLGKQIRHGRGIAYFRRGEFAGENLMMFVDRKMEFAPGPASRNIMLLLMPFVFTVDLESGGINDDEATRFERLGQDVTRYGNAALGNAAVVRNADRRLHEAAKLVHEAFGLA